MLNLRKKIRNHSKTIFNKKNEDIEDDSNNSIIESRRKHKTQNPNITSNNNLSSSNFSFNNENFIIKQSINESHDIINSHDNLDLTNISDIHYLKENKLFNYYDTEDIEEKPLDASNIKPIMIKERNSINNTNNFYLSNNTKSNSFIEMRNFEESNNVNNSQTNSIYEEFNKNIFDLETIKLLEESDKYIFKMKNTKKENGIDKTYIQNKNINKSEIKDNNNIKNPLNYTSLVDNSYSCSKEYSSQRSLTSRISKAKQNFINIIQNNSNFEKNINLQKTNCDTKENKTCTALNNENSKNVIISKSNQKNIVSHEINTSNNSNKNTSMKNSNIITQNTSKISNIEYSHLHIDQHDDKGNNEIKMIKEKNILNRNQSSRLSEKLKLIKKYEKELKEKSITIENQIIEICKLQRKLENFDSNQILKNEINNLNKQLIEKDKELKINVKHLENSNVILKNKLLKLIPKFKDLIYTNKYLEEENLKLVKKTLSYQSKIKDLEIEISMKESFKKQIYNISHNFFEIDKSRESNYDAEIDRQNSEYLNNNNMDKMKKNIKNVVDIWDNDDLSIINDTCNLNNGRSKWICRSCNVDSKVFDDNLNKLTSENEKLKKGIRSIYTEIKSIMAINSIDNNNIDNQYEIIKDNHLTKYDFEDKELTSTLNPSSKNNSRSGNTNIYNKFNNDLNHKNRINLFIYKLKEFFKEDK